MTDPRTIQGFREAGQEVPIPKKRKETHRTTSGATTGEVTKEIGKAFVDGGGRGVSFMAGGAVWGGSQISKIIADQTWSDNNALMTYSPEEYVAEEQKMGRTPGVMNSMGNLSPQGNEKFFDPENRSPRKLRPQYHPAIEDLFRKPDPDDPTKTLHGQTEKELAKGYFMDSVPEDGKATLLSDPIEKVHQSLPLDWAKMDPERVGRMDEAEQRLVGLAKFWGEVTATLPFFWGRNAGLVASAAKKGVRPGLNAAVRASGGYGATGGAVAGSSYGFFGDLGDTKPGADTVHKAAQMASIGALPGGLAPIIMRTAVNTARKMGSSAASVITDRLWGRVTKDPIYDAALKAHLKKWEDAAKGPLSMFKGMSKQEKRYAWIMAAAGDVTSPEAYNLRRLLTQITHGDPALTAKATRIHTDAVQSIEDGMRRRIEVEQAKAAGLTRKIPGDVMQSTKARLKETGEKFHHLQLTQNKLAKVKQAALDREYSRINKMAEGMVFGDGDMSKHQAGVIKIQQLLQPNTDELALDIFNPKELNELAAAIKEVTDARSTIPANLITGMISKVNLLERVAVKDATVRMRLLKMKDTFYDMFKEATQQNPEIFKAYVKAQAKYAEMVKLHHLGLWTGGTQNSRLDPTAAAHMMGIVAPNGKVKPELYHDLLESVGGDYRIVNDFIAAQFSTKLGQGKRGAYEAQASLDAVESWLHKNRSLFDDPGAAVKHLEKLMQRKLHNPGLRWIMEIDDVNFSTELLKQRPATMKKTVAEFSEDGVNLTRSKLNASLLQEDPVSRSATLDKLRKNGVFNAIYGEGSDNVYNALHSATEIQRSIGHTIKALDPNVDPGTFISSFSQMLEQMTKAMDMKSSSAASMGRQYALGHKGAGTFMLGTLAPNWLKAQRRKQIFHSLFRLLEDPKAAANFNHAKKLYERGMYKDSLAMLFPLVFPQFSQSTLSQTGAERPDHSKFDMRDQ